jgi:calcineurin-like phosphoesterase family protein
MSLTNYQIEQVIGLNTRLDWGGRRIAKAMGLSYGKVRSVLEGHEQMEAGEDDDFTHVVIIPDTQYPYVHQDSETALMEYITREQPDELLQIGDFADMEMLSRFSRMDPPSERKTFQEEVQIVRDKALLWANLIPGRKRLVYGNHEQRITRYLEANADVLWGFPELDIGNFLGFRDAGWECIGPYGEGTWIGHEKGIWATHGDYARKWSGATAKAHVMEKYGHSVIHGHTHRLGAFYHTNNMNGTVAGFEVGCLCDASKTPPRHFQADWQHGFASVWVSKTSPRFHVDLVAITDGGFVTGGKKYGR